MTLWLRTQTRPPSVAFAITNGYWIVATNGNNRERLLLCGFSVSALLMVSSKKPYFSSGQTIRGMGMGVFGTAAILSIDKNTTISGQAGTLPLTVR